ncbi:hypothetical protein BG846_01345 [Streptomyces fradiae ATCC 10745 = DSM 40063]|uniref:Uncharacterized protein n=1 Tax=Streptomyces fradiae ATCC 10745 = DSM 40063 TaxID=1319510 RepID=A0A1Y2NZK4_STRFR|nr:hypothetical protein BG846_01345 [Streptomyces fradiae ATCC 10745 = DSM 40063]
MSRTRRPPPARSEAGAHTSSSTAPPAPRTGTTAPARASTGTRDSGASTSTSPGPSYARSVATSYQRPRGSRTTRRRAPRASTGATSSASPSRNASPQSRRRRSSGAAHHSGRAYGAPVSRASRASVTKYGRNRSRSAIASRACSSASAPNSHGSRRPASIAECVRNSGSHAPSCSHRRYSSGDGWPSKPPTSGPEYGTPHSPSPSTRASDARSPGHPVATSPDHVPPYRCIPAQPDRENRNGRSSGRSRASPSYPARAIASPYTLCASRWSPPRPSRECRADRGSVMSPNGVNDTGSFMSCHTPEKPCSSRSAYSPPHHRRT